jgi:RHS repeat-associated protein
MRQLPSSLDAVPAQPTPAIESHSPHEPARSINTSHNAVLVVERDDSLTKFFAKSLPEQGYAVRTARDAEEGLRLYRDCSPFSVVVIDYFVPRKCGIPIDCLTSQTYWSELVTSIREIDRSQRIIVVAFSYRNAEEVPCPTELRHIPLLTDIADLRLQRLLEKLEVERAIEVLTEGELLKLQKYAAFRIRGLGPAACGRTGEDLFNEAVLKTLHSEVGPLGTTNYFYDGNNLLDEVDNTGVVLARYAQGKSLDEPLAEFRSGTASYYETDGLGSSTSLSNSSSALANTYSYDSFGNLTASAGTVTNPFRYTAREFDAETGTYEYRARYFDPTIGRFISEEPLRFAAGMNFFAYVHNNPVGLDDPTRLCDKNCQLSISLRTDS